MNELREQAETFAQLDCQSINEYFNSLHIQWVSQSFKYLPRAVELLRDEIQLLVKLLQFFWTVAEGRPQPGDEYYCIQFVFISKQTKILWFIISTVLPYILKKINKILFIYRRTTVGKGIGLLWRVLKVTELINYSVFLFQGRYRSLGQRMLGIRMKVLDPKERRAVSSDYINRGKMYEVYQFFLKTAFPSAARFLNAAIKNVFYLDSFIDPEEDLSCVFCSSPQPVNPYKYETCGHRACYYCWRVKGEEKCARCGAGREEWSELYETEC